MKKCISILATLCMVLSLFPVNAIAAPAADDVAAIEDVGYTTLEAAIEAATDNQTIKLLSDITLDTTITLDKNITLDLANHTVTGAETISNNRTFLFKSTGNVTIQNGAIKSNTSRGISVNAGNFNLNNVKVTTIKRALFLDNATATVDKNSVLSIAAGGDDAPIIVWGTGNYKTEAIAHHPTLNFYGTADARNSKKPYAAIQGNGTDYSYTYINIYDSALLTSRGTALYAPQAGEVNVSGGTVNGDGAAIGIKSGKLTITGGKLMASDAYEKPATMSGGIATGGSTIAVDSNNGYAGEMEISVGGSAVLSSKNGHAIQEIGKTDDTTSVVSLSITGGTFNTAKTPVDVRPITADQVQISGGNFSVSPDYIASDAAQAVLNDTLHLIGTEISAAKYAPNDKLNVLSGDLTLTNAPLHMSITNSGEGTVSVNGLPVAKDATVIIHKFNDTWVTDANQHWHECECGEKSGIENHNFTEEITTAPTCTQNGLVTYTCTVCGFSYTEDIPATQHTLVHVPEVPATSEATGILEHWKCSSCGALFIYEDATFEVTEEMLLISQVESGEATVEQPAVRPGTSQAQQDAIQSAHNALNQPNAVKESGLSRVLSVSVDNGTGNVTVFGMKDKATGKNELLIPAETIDQVVIDNNLDNADDIVFVTESFLKVQVVDAKVTAKNDGTMVTSKITFNITPYANLKLRTDIGEALITTAPMAVNDEVVKITLTLPDNFEVAADEKIIVEHVKSDGTKYCYDVVRNGNQISFETTHGFSEFSVIAVPKSAETPDTPDTPDQPHVPSNPTTGDKTPIVLYVVMAVIAVAGIVLIVFFTKKNKHDSNQGKRTR